MHGSINISTRARRSSLVDIGDITVKWGVRRRALDIAGYVSVDIMTAAMHIVPRSSCSSNRPYADSRCAAALPDRVLIGYQPYNAFIPKLPS